MRIKICGITRPQDAELAVRCEANAIGLNFYDRSPRCVSPSRAREILTVVPPDIEPVAVMVAADEDAVRSVLGTLGLRAVQFHATNPDHVSAGIPPGITIILAHGVDSRADLDTVRSALESWGAAGLMIGAVLVDARVPGLHGGSGKTAPWHVLADFDPGVPLILAGGLTPDNVAEAIQIVLPYAVDVASGVEQSPGIKDPEKMRRFIGNARDAAAKYL